MRNTTNQAFSEVYDVINHMSKEMQEKIPKSFINLIKDNRDLEYTFNIDYTIDIKKQLLKESKVILSLVYRDYLCSKEKREELLTLDLEEIRREEKILQEKYQIDFEIRKKEKIQNEEELKDKEQEEQEKQEEKNLPIEVEKEKWYMKIFNFIKKIFKR